VKWREKRMAKLNGGEIVAKCGGSKCRKRGEESENIEMKENIINGINNGEMKKRQNISVMAANGGDNES